MPNHVLQYMVQFTLPEELDMDFLSMVPEQRMVINRLFEERKLLSYALTEDRQTLWASIQALDEVDVVQIIEMLPLTYRMEYRIFPLMFNEVSKPGFPALSLN